MTEKIFLSCPRNHDWGLIYVVSYFRIWNKSEQNIIIYRVISNHIGPMYIETPYIYIYIYIYTHINTHRHKHTDIYIYIYIYIYTYICPWCNGYRRRKWTRRHKFKSWTRLIAFHIALIPLGKVWIQLFSLQLWVNNRAD